VARGWRTPVIGELMMGFTTRWGLRRELPRELADHAWEHFDQGTQRAILRLYRSADPKLFEQYGARLGELRCPALILWPEDDPYIGAEFGTRYREALGGDTELEFVTGGHWTWHERPGLVGQVAEFLGTSR
jgi:pimeloyl-ACP methyl ester carboxylesterase